MSSFKVYTFFLIILVCACGEKNKQASESENNQPDSSQRISSDTAQITPAAFRDAALNGDIETVRNAIGQDVDIHDADELGRTAMMFAAFNGHTEIVQLLAGEGADIHQANSENRTPLMFASSGPFPETVEFLLQEGAEPNVQDNVEHWTPLMYAAAEGNLEVIKILIEYDADASLEDDDGETALDFARNNGHTDVVTLLEN